MPAVFRRHVRCTRGTDWRSLMHPRLTTKEKRFLQRARVARIGSVDRRGATHVAPLCHAFDPARRTAYVATSGLTAKNLHARRQAAIACDDYYEDWDRLRGIVAHARARFVHGGAEL